MKQHLNARVVKPAITPEYILARHSTMIRRIAERLRKLIRAAAPEAMEAAYPGWHAIGYRHPDCGYFCGLFPFDDHVKLVFEFGVLLDDPFHVLEGDGKQVRHIVYRNVKEVQAQPIDFLIEQAIRLRVRKRRVKGNG
ncbi:DUF1801 domain-containing protein [candidate division KSB1 bacterium]|nr:DUF1801 domain-containing protein [candidate division KSB1 bacterium]